MIFITVLYDAFYPGYVMYDSGHVYVCGAGALFYFLVLLLYC